MPFEKSVLVPLNADETFALITQPDRLRRWQVITARVDLRAGGEYRWTVIPGNSAAGTFTEVEPGRRVVFTWGWEGSAELPPGASTVIITLEPAAGGTMVHLTHEGLSGEQEASHGAGWTHYLGRLITAATAAFAEKGADAPLEDIARRAGVGIGTLYRHFPTRLDLQAAVFRSQVGAVCGEADALLEKAPPGQAFSA